MAPSGAFLLNKPLDIIQDIADTEEVESWVKEMLNFSISGNKREEYFASFDEAAKRLAEVPGDRRWHHSNKVGGQCDAPIKAYRCDSAKDGWHYKLIFFK